MRYDDCIIQHPEETRETVWVGQQSEGNLPRLVKNGWLGNGMAVPDALSHFTTWDNSMRSFDDERFWSEHLVARDGAEFRYLRPL